MAGRRESKPKVSVASSTPLLDQVKMIREQLEKRYKTTTELFPDFTVIKRIPVIRSRSAIINVVTGIGGFPRTRVTEIFGPESSGKTTVATETAVTAQQDSPTNMILFVDLEHAFDAVYAHKLGLNLTNGTFIFSQPDYFEQAEDVIYTYVDAGLVDMVIVDTMAAMTPKTVLEGAASDVMRIGIQSQLTARFLDKLTKKITYGRKPAVVLLNQTRTKMDKISAHKMNVYEESASGKALKFYASIRIKMEIVRKEGEFATEDPEAEEQKEAKDARRKDNEQLYYRNRVRLTTVKNKLAPPWLRAQLVIDYGQGINNIVSIAELAERKLGLISAQGYYNYQGDTPQTSVAGRGREQFGELLKERPELFKEIESKVIAAIRAEQAQSLGLTGIPTHIEPAKEIAPEDPITLEEDDVTGVPLPEVDDSPALPSFTPGSGEDLPSEQV